MSGIAVAWKRALARCPALAGIMIVWALSVLIALRPDWAPVPAAFLAASACALSSLSLRKSRMFKAAAVFLAFWSLAAWLLSGPGPSAFRATALAAWLFAGLHLFFVWSPVGLGRAAALALRPVAGRRRATLLGLALTALAKAAPAVLSDAFAARRSLGRVRHLGFFRCTALWGRATVRLALKRSVGLGRTLAKRQRELA
ncbi:MAG: hypothetical protein LBR80_04290 [Deltaproteobacteria bacterium]|nr:hypothetical protein [Deltaproteobacteria bacterium]